jgi:hypothetical protein
MTLTHSPIKASQGGIRQRLKRLKTSLGCPTFQTINQLAKSRLTKPKHSTVHKKWQHPHNKDVQLFKRRRQQQSLQQVVQWHHGATSQWHRERQWVYPRWASLSRSESSIQNRCLEDSLCKHSAKTKTQLKNRCRYRSNSPIANLSIRSSHHSLRTKIHPQLLNSIKSSNWSSRTRNCLRRRYKSMSGSWTEPIMANRRLRTKAVSWANPRAAIWLPTMD